MEDVVYLEKSDAQHHKFYELAQQGEAVRLRWGRIGCAGQRRMVCLSTPAEAQDWARRRIAAKLRKGYERAKRGARPYRPLARPRFAETTQGALFSLEAVS